MLRQVELPHEWVVCAFFTACERSGHPPPPALRFTFAFTFGGGSRMGHWVDALLLGSDSTRDIFASFRWRLKQLPRIASLRLIKQLLLKAFIMQMMLKPVKSCFYFLARVVSMLV